MKKLILVLTLLANMPVSGNMQAFLDTLDCQAISDITQKTYANIVAYTFICERSDGFYIYEYVEQQNTLTYYIEKDTKK